MFAFVAVRIPCDGSACHRQVVADLMATLQTEGDKGMEKVLATSAPGNPFVDLGYEKVSRSMNPKRARKPRRFRQPVTLVVRLCLHITVHKVCMYMRESKLAVLLGHFEQFKIISNKDMGMDDKGRVRYQVWACRGISHSFDHGLADSCRAAWPVCATFCLARHSRAPPATPCDGQ